MAVDEPVRLVTPAGNDQPAILQDVSSGGACVRTHQRLKVGEQILLSMFFGLHQKYDIYARVVYAKPGARGFHARYGVRFVWISDDERYRLDTFVNERVNASQYGVRGFPGAPHSSDVPRS